METRNDMEHDNTCGNLEAATGGDVKKEEDNDTFDDHWSISSDYHGAVTCTGVWQHRWS